MSNAPSRWMIIAAFASVYLIWGSTYLGIKIGIESIPPFVLSAARFVLAGLILYGISRSRGCQKPTLGNWRHAIIVGGLLIVGGNGLVAVAEVHITSSLAALIIACNPLFMTLFGWWSGVQKRPNFIAWASLFGGLAGVALLIASDLDLSDANSLTGVILVFVAIILWTGGSIFSKRVSQDIDLLMQAGMQMFCGGLMSLCCSFALGEFSEFSLTTITDRSWGAYIYLVLIGSLIGFPSYVFLLKHCSPSAVASHAYVNPVVAIILGWIILAESISPLGIAGSGLIIVSVYTLLRASSRQATT